MASKRRKSTACLECTDTDAFTQLSAYRLPSVLKTDLSAHRDFRIYDVDYYPNVKKEALPALLNSGHEILILDFGCLSNDSMDELYRCDKKLILGSAAPWLLQSTYEHIMHYPQIKNMESLSLMIKNATNPDIAELARKLSLPHGKIHAVPFLPNPFHIEKEQFSFFEKLL